MCPAHEDKVEIKCVGSVGRKAPIEPKLFYSSLTLGTSKHVKVDIMCIVHSYNMADKIRRMIVTFEYIYQKEWSFLTYGRIVHLYKNVSNFT